VFVPVLEKQIAFYSMIRVAIADDHPELRLALRLMLHLSKDTSGVFENSNGQEAIDCVKQRWS
jgi:DNA-binding NarL/FixJ family response regulator